MTANTPSHLIPKLRFPEFRDMPEWEPRQLSDVLGYEQPGKYIVEDTNYQDTGTPVLTANKGFVLGYTADTDGVYDNVPAIIFDDFTTDTKYVDFAFKVKSSAIKILTSRRDDELKLLFELMSRIRFDSTQHKRYYISQYQHLEIPLPTRAEQQKVADCLGSLDDLIAAEGRKLEALRQHKQGLMQQLFPQTGQSRPRLRFPEFRNAVEWQRCALGEIADISRGKGISKSDVVQGGRTPCVRYGELYTSYGEIIEIVKSRTNLSAPDLVLSNAGDVIIPASGETKEEIATCACVVDDGVALGSDLNVIRSPVDGRFFSYYLNGSRRRELSKVAQGDTVAHLYPTQLSRLEIYIPGLKAEQQRIGDCLSTLDARLAAQVQKLNILKTHKQGLLQQLFPSLEAES